MTESLLATAPAWVAVTLLAITIQVVVPLVAGWVAVRRLGVGWRFFWYGALVFFVSQMVARLPLVQVGQVLLQDALSSTVVQWIWIVVLSFSAGLFEEVGRWIGYRWLFRPEERTWRPAVVYGLGHGGLESMVLIAGLGVLSLVGLLAMTSTDLSQLQPEQREAVQAQLAAVAAQPAWFPLLGAWERLSAMTIHVGLSLIVLQAFRRASWVWLPVAILVHGTVNVVGLTVLRLVGGMTPAGLVLVEVVIMLMAIAVLWGGLRLRDREDEANACPASGA
ncbi:MAG TPA: YhfC family glutamic-type intramembrane protease [Chloroflexota bacterium]|nr:YhfC family glutamic-type intramembrane protease [Chloroflexota bacterium]